MSTSYKAEIFYGVPVENPSALYSLLELSTDDYSIDEVIEKMLEKDKLNNDLMYTYSLIASSNSSKDKNTFFLARKDTLKELNFSSGNITFNRFTPLEMKNILNDINNSLFDDLNGRYPTVFGEQGIYHTSYSSY